MLGIGSSVGKSVAGGFLPKSEVLKLAAYWITVVTGGLLIGLGLLIIFVDDRYIIGPICIGLGAFILSIELFAVKLRNFSWFVTIFDYKIRGPMYILFCIPPFFTVYTIAPALGCIAGGGVYAALGWIKDEKAELPEAGAYEKQRDVENQRDNERL